MNPKDDDRRTNPSEQELLSEKDFIQNGWTIASLPFWLWLFLIPALALTIWGTKGWYDGLLKKEKTHEPFLEVTNRQFSVFLWQFPSFLRNHAGQKTGYLPGFLSTQENINLETAENFVSAPPDLLFLYHIWSRLLEPEAVLRPISMTEFSEFLEQLPEWQPKNWKNAPEGYVRLIESKKDSDKNLENLSEEVLPRIVKLAFQGWKNYFKEGEKINDLKPTLDQVKAFLEKYPHYARNYWRNIGEINHQRVAGLDYLRDTLRNDVDQTIPLPDEQLASFLKVAMFNADQAQQNH